MTNTSETLGIEFTLGGLKEALKGFADLRQEARDTGKELEQIFADVAAANKKVGPRRRGGSGSGSGSGSGAPVTPPVVTVNPSGIVTARATNNRLRIDIYLRGLSGSGGGIGGGPRGPRTPWLPSGPRQQQARLEAAMRHAQATGNTLAYEDAREAHERVSRRLAPKSTSDRLLEWLGTSRFGAAGGRIQPLIGRTMDMVPGGRNSPLAKGILGIGILGSAALELGKMFFSLSAKGNEFAVSIGKFNGQTGGSIKENNALRGYALNAGIPDDEALSATKGLQAAITGGGYGQIIGAKFGVRNLPGMFGHQDWAKDEIKVLEGLRREYRSDKSPNHANSLRDIRALGQESFIPAFQLDDKQFQKGMATIGNGPSADVIKRAMEFDRAMGRLDVSFKNLLATLAGNGGLTETINGLADFLDRLRKPEGTNVGSAGGGGGGVHPRLSPQLRKKTDEDIQKWLSTPLPKGLSGPRKGFELPFGAHISFGSASARAESAYQRSLQRRQAEASRAQDQLKALKKNADNATGIKELIELVKRGYGMPGSYGNMSRQGVMPGKIDSGYVLNKYLGAKALQLSAF